MRSIGSVPVTALARPQTGKEFSLTRELMGISLRSAAICLDIDTSTLRRWESDVSAVDVARAKQWRNALAVCAQLRSQELARSGFTVGDLQQTDLGFLLTRLSSRKFG